MKKHLPRVYLSRRSPERPIRMDLGHEIRCASYGDQIRLLNRLRDEVAAVLPRGSRLEADLNEAGLYWLYTDPGPDRDDVWRLACKAASHFQDTGQPYPPDRLPAWAGSQEEASEPHGSGSNAGLFLSQ